MPNDPNPRHRPRRTALFGVAIGALAVVASLLAFAGGATAQDSQPTVLPADAEIVTEEAPELDDEYFDEDGYSDDEDFEDDEYFEDDDYFEDLDFTAFDECLEDNLGIGEDAGEDAWEALGEDQWLAAEAACEELLPAEVLEMEKAFDAFDACLAEQGLDVENELGELGEGPVVFVEGESAETMAAFGDGDGSITITKTGDEVSVATTGDVEVVENDYAAIDQAFDACEELLPEDVDFDDEFEDDEFEDDDAPEDLE